ncbi:EF-hand domain-containing protein [Marinobacter halodurans]|uniref:EF-hand domain-containing protein n=1 Tax=Marinobacter halodurans TaxID=2528979 RepID=A0ABY1ZJF9_9GAMM|nr:EF-hand domain-containing protein [Marinobacter halodurans]TBW54890.1 EF-hand domain-containing protein [Marinobacter halodurans]
MIKPIAAFLSAVLGLLLVGCAATSDQPAPGRQLAEGPRGQFQCADRNSNDYIDRAELVYLRQCGIGEDLRCGSVPDTMEPIPAKAEFEGGRRMLEVMDADGDNRISKLEFRAHCNSNRY